MPRIQALGAAGQFQSTQFAGALVFDEQALPGVEVSFEFELAAFLVCQVVFACVDAFELDALAFGGIESTHDRRKMTRYLRSQGPLHLTVLSASSRWGRFGAGRAAFSVPLPDGTLTSGIADWHWGGSLW
ncbi:hypothetical protein IU427_23690 [Nocardia beijingensis]|uniref:hypothetical protein n=1 Tax=Nocardia beijingensis TaxID=95162 RepID=UPI001893272A|nr:hypothetical protein [Nocardia beijingensis]MBF6468165.1 hypothetical protein [Nocardia beijingensis]